MRSFIVPLLFIVIPAVLSSDEKTLANDQPTVIESKRPDATDVSHPESLASRRFLGGLSASLYVIVISELGDKTFFIAAIMSMQHSRCLVYFGAMCALATMTVLSAILGYATTVIPRIVTYYCSGILFLLFGLKMLYDAYIMVPSNVQEEYDEMKLKLSQSSTDLEKGSPEHSIDQTSIRQSFKQVFSSVLAEAFILTFLAEWGDRSQLTTIVLAATKSVSGVIVGGVLGHALCTGLAVLVGRFIAQRIPVKWLTYVGGVTFLVFAVCTFLGNPDPNS